MPADEWFIVQPDQVLHKDLAESSLERWIKKRDGDLAYDDDTISTRVPMVSYHLKGRKMGERKRESMHVHSTHHHSLSIQFYKDTDHNTIDSLAKSVSTLMKTALLGRPIMIDDRIENRLDELSPESDLHFELVLSPGSAVVPKTDDNGEEEEATISDHEVKPPTKNSDHDSATAAGHDESGSSVISLTFTRHTYSSIRENNPSIGSSSTAISLRFDRRGIWEDLIKVKYKKRKIIEHYIEFFKIYRISLKFVEKGATDISREVLKITSKIKQLTCKSVDSFVRTSQDFFKYPVRFIVSATKGGFIAVIINSVKEAISAFVDTVYGVIRLVENMMTKVATSMQGIIDFFKVNRE